MPDSDSTAGFFEALGAIGHSPLLSKASGTIRFDLTQGKKTERWLVTIKRGDVSVSRRNLKADCVIRCDKALFHRLAEGEENAMAALLRGAIELEGDPGLVVLVQRLLPGPRSSRDKRRAAGYARRQT
jgi:putative sterol carrier protein